jgi:hypothetical protein
MAHEGCKSALTISRLERELAEARATPSMCGSWLTSSLRRLDKRRLAQARAALAAALRENERLRSAWNVPCSCKKRNGLEYGDHCTSCGDVFVHGIWQ